MRGTTKAGSTPPPRRPSPRKTRLTLAAVTAATVLLIAPSAAFTAIPGEHRWADPVPSSHGNDEAMAVTTNAAGHAILAGDVLSSGGDYDISYRSYLPDGTPRWDATWDGSGGIDWTAAVTVDKVNNCVYVAGTTESPDGDTDYVLLRVRDADSPGGSPGGGLIWKRTFNASHGKDEEAGGIARDKYGSVYVAGRSQRSDGSWDMHVVKYKRNGTRAWARRVNTGPGHYDEGAAIAVRGSSVFVAGVSENYPGSSGHILLVRFSLGGSRKWARYHDLLNTANSVTDIAATSNAIYICGSGRKYGGKPDTMLFKCGLDGRRKWATFTSGSKSGGNDVWTDLAVDNKGRIHVTGFCTRKGTREDIVTRLYSSSGTRLWQHIYPSEADSADVGTALAIDSSRHTYVCGWRTSGGDEEAIVIKYGTGGDVLWESVYPDPGNYPGETDSGDDWANDVTVRGENVYVVGAHDVDHGGSVDADFLSLALWR